MKNIFSLLAVAVGIYSLLIFFRIILSWFTGVSFGRTSEILAKITDPYLNFWRKIFTFRIGFLDFSVVAAIICLSLLQGILTVISSSNRIYLGLILAFILSSIWALISFIMGFCLIIILIKGIAYLTRRNMYGQFWSIIDSIYQPISYQINRIIFGSRIVKFTHAMIVSLIVLLAVMICGRIGVNLLTDILYRLPV